VTDLSRSQLLSCTGRENKQAEGFSILQEKLSFSTPRLSSLSARGSNLFLFALFILFSPRENIAQIHSQSVYPA